MKIQIIDVIWYDVIWYDVIWCDGYCIGYCIYVKCFLIIVENNLCSCGTNSEVAIKFEISAICGIFRAS